jgi:hypothetical protein
VKEPAEKTTICFTNAACMARAEQIDVFGRFTGWHGLLYEEGQTRAGGRYNDVFINRLAGVHRLVEVNTCLRCDLALQKTTFVKARNTNEYKYI